MSAKLHFHVRDGQYSPDPDGLELSGEEEAQRQAVATLGQMLRDDPASFLEHASLSVIVTDDDGQKLFAVSAKVDPAPPAR